MLAMTSATGRGESGEPEGPGRAVRVVIVDDHALLRAGTRQILADADGIEVVGEAADGDEAVAVVATLDPDVLLLDIRMPGRNGIEVSRHLASIGASTRIVVLSAYDDEDYVRAALAAGVAGYLLKTMPGDELARAVRAVHAGMTVLDPAVSAVLAQPLRSAATAGSAAGLSWREREVVGLVAEGLANKTIAGRLGISTRTVEGHLNHVFTKLGVVSRTELVRFALDNGLATTDKAPPGPEDGQAGGNTHHQ